MIKIHFPKLKKAIQRTSGRLLTSCVVLAAFTGSNAFSQLSYTFTPCGATGSLGPTQAQVTAGYNLTNLSGNVTVSGSGIQVWTVPSSGAYRIETRGAQGGTSGGVNPGASGGLGAIMIGDFNLTAGQTLSIVVGQQGSGSNYGGSGGGGTYVVASNTVPLCVAGGGGGAIGYSGYSNGFYNGGPGLTSTAGGSANVVGGGTYGVQALGSGGGAPGYGGTIGYGGGSGVASGGAGFIGDGANGGTPTNPTYSGGGRSFLNGSSGGIGAQLTVNSGGFGGGGGTQASSGYGAGGGGYSGGGGGSLLFSPNASGNGGGGGSYNAGANQNNTSGVNTGDGRVIISDLCNVNVVASSSAACSGGSVSLTTNAASNYSWSTGNTTSSVIVVNPTVTTTYSVSGIGTNPSGCAGNAAVTITVNTSAPALVATSNTTSACLGNTVSISVSGALTYTLAPTFTSGVAFTPPAGTNNYTVTGANGCGITTSVVTINVSQLPVSATASSTLICSSTPATLTASGATTYSWVASTSTVVFSGQSNIVSPLVNTTYTLTGMTGSCVGTGTIGIVTKPLPALVVSSSNSAICNGASTSLNVSGNAVTYTWNPGNQNGTSISVTPTTTTLYSVIGTNSVNCTSSLSEVILVFPAPVVNTSASNPVVCSGGSSTLTANGASTYIWSNNDTNSSTVVNPTSSTVYSVTATSANSLGACSTVATVNVDVLTPTIGVSGDVSVCSGTNVIISANGADSYAWSNGASGQSISLTPTLSAVYTVTGSVTDPNTNIVCNATNSLQVTVNANPVVTATSNHSVICLTTSAILSAGGAVSYTWTGGSGAATTVDYTVTPITNQTFSVAGIDANNCKGKTSITVQVSACTGIASIAANTINLMIYPNPSNGEFTITSDQNITLQIVNELGQQVKTITLDNTNHEVKVSNLASGIYFVTGHNENGSVKEKIIVEK